MKKTLLLSITALGMAFAQPPQPPQVHIVTRGAAGVASPLTVDLVGPTSMALAGKAVKGMPYSADAVNETTQTLTDGNRISRKSSTFIARDSQGRTRNEMVMPNVGPWATGKDAKIVNIFDPVAKVSITLHPDKTAVKMPMPDLGTWSESSNGSARTMVFTRRVESRSASAHSSEDIVIERHVGPEDKLPTVGGTRMTIRDGIVGGVAAPGNRSFRRETLGKKMIEGVEAEGTRMVSTIPAGEIGNERDIEIVDETWYSKEIEALVYSRHTDPQTGETTFRLTNIQRSEPPITLFEVPGDYKLNDGPGRMEFKIRSDRPGKSPEDEE